MSLSLPLLAADAVAADIEQSRSPVVRVVNSPAGQGLTSISLHLRDASPREIFAELGRQAGVSFVGWPGSVWDRLGGQRLGIEADGQSFWSVALAAATACGAKLEPASLDENERRILVNWRDAGDAAGTQRMAGPLLLQAGALRVSKEQGGLELPLTVFADPSLRVYRFLGQPELEEAKDDAGASLLPARAKDKPLAMPPGLMTRTTLHLAAPAAGHTFMTLRGSMTLIVATQLEDWKIDLSRGGASKTIGKTTYTFVGLAPKDGGYELTLQIKSPADIDLASPLRELCVSPQSLLCSDAAGYAYRITQVAASYSSRHITGVGNSEYAIGLKAADKDAAGPLTSITWRLPTEVSNLEAPFEFSGLALP